MAVLSEKMLRVQFLRMVCRMYHFRALCTATGEVGEGPPVCPVCPTPQVPLSMPLWSTLRHKLRPERSLQVVLEMLDLSKLDFSRGKLNIRGQMTQGRLEAKCDHMRAWLVETDRLQHETQMATPTEPQIPDAPNTAENLRFLVLLCLELGDPRYLEALIGLAERNKLEMTESHYNQLLIAMDRLGWRRPLARNFRRLVKMGVKCRIGTMYTLVLNAVRKKDYRFVTEVMEELTHTVRSMCSHNRCGVSMRMDLVVEACVGAGQWGEAIVGHVLEWYRAMEIDLTQNMVDALVKWLKRYVVLY